MPGLQASDYVVALKRDLEVDHCAARESVGDGGLVAHGVLSLAKPRARVNYGAGPGGARKARDRASCSVGDRPLTRSP